MQPKINKQKKKNCEHQLKTTKHTYIATKLCLKTTRTIRFYRKLHTHTNTSQQTNIYLV